MALNPNIPLSARPSDLSQVGESVSRGISDSLRIKQTRQQGQLSEQQGRLNEQQGRLNEQQILQNNFKALDEEKQRVTTSVVHAAAELELFVDNNDHEGIESFLINRIAELNESKTDSSHTQKELQNFRDDPHLFKSNVKNAINFGERLGLLNKSEGSEGFTLGKEQQRFDAQGKLIAQGAKEEEKGFTLGTGQQRFDAQGNIIAQGIKEEDKAPDGYRFTETGNLEPIPGGEADFERKTGREKAIKAIELGQAKAILVNNKVNQALALIDTEGGVTGLSGKVSGLVAGTDAFTLKKIINTLDANLAFEALQAMRDASPTGGALGQVSEMELVLLRSAVTSLDIGLTKDVLIQNLNEVKMHYGKFLEAITKATQETSTSSEQFEVIRIR